MTDADPEPVDLDDLYLYTIPEAVDLLRISRSHFHSLVRQGKLHTLRLGSRTVVPRAEIRRLIREALDR